jgi:hypothetical protein
MSKTDLFMACVKKGMSPKGTKCARMPVKINESRHFQDAETISSWLEQAIPRHLSVCATFQCFN